MSGGKKFKVWFEQTTSRIDKAAEDATTSEIVEMYQKQLKKNVES